MLKSLRGQSTLEYALIIAVVVGALLAMQVYMRRGVQGKLRESTDDIGGQYSAGNVQAKYITSQPAGKQTTEKFGTTDIGGAGVSRTQVDVAAAVTTTTVGGKKEEIAKTFQQELNDEGLYGK